MFHWAFSFCLPQVGYSQLHLATDMSPQAPRWRHNKVSLPRIELATWWSTRRSLLNPFATEPTDDGFGENSLNIDIVKLIISLWDKVDLALN